MAFHGDYSEDYYAGNGISLINGCVWGTCLCHGPLDSIESGKISATFTYISLKSTQARKQY